MPRIRLTISGSSMLVLSALLFCGLPLVAQDSTSSQPTISEPIHFAISPPLRELAKLPRLSHYGFHEALPVRRIPKRTFELGVDPVEQKSVIGIPSIAYSIGLNFLGVGNGFPGFAVSAAPPDTNMAVGDNQIVQWVNTSFAVFNKFDGSISAGPIDGNLLWSALNDDCSNNNDGDIIAQWDNACPSVGAGSERVSPQLRRDASLLRMRGCLNDERRHRWLLPL